MYKYISLLLILILASCTFAQNDVNTVLDYTLSYRGLTREDVTIPIDFFSAAEKSPTNDSKLLLPIVRDIMINPLRSMTWIDSVSGWGDIPMDKIILNSFDMLNEQVYIYNYGIYASDPISKDLSEKLAQVIKQIRKNNTEPLKRLSLADKKYLEKYLLTIFEETEEDDMSNYDILSYNKLRDSSIIRQKNVLDILSLIDQEKIRLNSVGEFFYCYNLYNDNLKELILIKK